MWVICLCLYPILSLFLYIIIRNVLFIFFFFKFYFIFKLYITVLVLPNIKMNPPQVYSCLVFPAPLTEETVLSSFMALLS